MIQDLHGNGNGIHCHEHLESDEQVNGNGNSFHFHELVNLNQDHSQDHELDQNDQNQNIQGNQYQIQETGNYSGGTESSLRSIRQVFQGSSRVIQFEFDVEKAFAVTEIQVEESNLSSSGNCLILKIGAIPANKLKPFRSKTSIILITVTAQIAGSLLAVAKQGSGTGPPAQVLALLYTSAICNAAGFLAALGGFWFQHAGPGAAGTMAKFGCAFTVLGFMGMMGIFFS